MNHLWVDMTVLRGRGRQATKINITFLVGYEALNTFHLTFFLNKKKQYFPNNIFLQLLSYLVTTLPDLFRS